MLSRKRKGPPSRRSDVAAEPPCATIKPIREAPHIGATFLREEHLREASGAMTIPASLLHHAEQHGCFSGCFGTESDSAVCTDVRQPPHPVVQVSCKDCLSFKIGTLRSLLPAGNATCYWLASALTQHFRARRGYTWAVAGYHAQGPGFWLSAAYVASAGLFLLDGERSRGRGSDLDLLLLAFQHGVAPVSDPGMLDVRQYATRVAYLNFGGLAGPVGSLAGLLASPHCLAQQKP